MPTSERSLKVAVGLTSLLAIASVTIAIAALFNSSATRPTVREIPLSGVYADGASGQPHYFVAVSSLGEHTLTGSMDFVYQDGQTSVVFTFQGSVQQLRPGANVAVLTLVPSLVPQDGSASQKRSSVPTAISAVYQGKGLSFGECGNYLHFVPSLAGCQFTHVNDNEL